MNPELPTDPRQALEASLTAMLLGELPPEQVEFLERVLANDAGLRATHERLKQTLGFIREAEQSPASPQPAATEPLKLSDTRRTQLLQHFKTVRPKELAPKPRRKVSVVIAIAAVLVLTALLAAMLLPALARSKSRSMHFATATTPLSGHPSSDEAVVVIGGKAHNIDARRLALKPGPELGNGVPYVDRAGSTIILPKGDEVQNGAAPESQVALGFAPQSEWHKQILVEARLRPELAPPAQSDGFAVTSKAPAEQPRDAGAVKYQDFDKDGLFLNYSIPAQQNLARGNVEQFNRRQLQDGLRNSPESAAAQSAQPGGIAPPPPATSPAQPLFQNNGENMARFRARYGLAGGGAGYGGGDTTKSLVPLKGEIAQGLRGRTKTLGEPVTGLPAMETAVNEAVTHQSEAIREKEKLAELARSDQDQNQAGGRKGKDREEELGRVPILGDKPLIGRAYGEQSANAGVEFVPQKATEAKEMAGKPITAGTDLNGLEKKMPSFKGEAKSIEQLADASKGWSGGESVRRVYDDNAGKINKPSVEPKDVRTIEVDSNQLLQGFGFDWYLSARQGSRQNSQNLGGVPKSGGGYGGGLLTVPRVNVAGGEYLTASTGGGVKAYTGLGGILQTNSYSRTNLLFTGDAKGRLYSKLDNIHFDSVSFDGLPLTDVIKFLNDEAQRRDPEKKGINFLINQNPPQGPAQANAVDPATGLPLGAQAVDPTTGLPLPLSPPEPVELSQVLVKIVPPLRDVSLADVLDAIAKVADAPIQFSVEDYAVVCSPKPRNSTDLAELKIDLGKAPINTPTNQQTDVAPPKPATPPPIPQPEIDTRENAFSTFSLNVSDVSFKLAAANLEKGALPDPAGIRSEEFINAFDYHDPEPPAGMPVGFAFDRALYPFAVNRDLLRFSIKTAAQGRESGRPLNLVILLDNSGSMERADRVRIIREALHVLAGQLGANDKLSLVTFARTAQLRVDGVSGSQATNVADEASELTPQGGTNLEDAMNLAYETARKHYLPNGINRVVLLTDGAANLGDVEPENLKKKVEDHRKQGIALDCFGIGWEGYNDDLLEVLSRNGDGRYGFINTPEEASTEFVSQLAGALHVAASDVKVQVEFNPDRVANWRQIGYAKHQLTKEQFRDNTVDAAELGAAESGNALYVVETRPNGQGPVATVRVRYKVPGTTDYHEHEWPVPYTGNATSLEQAAPTIRLAAVASGFSEWLATNAFAADITLDSLLGYLRGIPETYAADPRPQKLEWMLRQAKSLSGK